jgi:hypothetical protein
VAGVSSAFPATNFITRLAAPSPVTGNYPTLLAVTVVVVALLLAGLVLLVREAKGAGDDGGVRRVFAPYC